MQSSGTRPFKQVDITPYDLAGFNSSSTLRRINLFSEGVCSGSFGEKKSPESVPGKLRRFFSPESVVGGKIRGVGDEFKSRSDIYLKDVGDFRANTSVVLIVLKPCNHRL